MVRLKRRKGFFDYREEPYSEGGTEVFLIFSHHKMLLLAPKKLFQRTKRLCLSCLVFLFVFIFGLTPAFSDSLDQKQGELDSIRQQISKYENAIAGKQVEIGSLKDQIGLMNSQIKKLELEIQATNLEIEKNQTEISKVAKEIKAKEKEIKRQKRIVGRLVLLMYQKEQTGVLEIILESEDFSDFLDQLTYLEVVEKQGQEAINYLKELKGELDAQKLVLKKKKKELVKLRDKQTLQKRDLIAQRSSKDKLLYITQGEENSYQEMLTDSQSKASQIEADLKAMRDRSGGYYYKGHGTGGYPWAHYPAYPYIDDGYGYYIRQCTSYAAWKWRTVGRYESNHWGNARTWASQAVAVGLNIDHVPEVGDIYCWTGGSYGHVGYVESVSGDSVTISDYNGDGVSAVFGYNTIRYAGRSDIFFIH